ncbi:hypothetical protein D3C80_1836040 [compost metagenome]
MQGRQAVARRVVLILRRIQPQGFGQAARVVTDKVAGAGVVTGAADDGGQLSAFVVAVFTAERRIPGEGQVRQAPGPVVARLTGERPEGAGALAVKLIALNLEQRCAALRHAQQVAGAVGQPVNGR